MTPTNSPRFPKLPPTLREQLSSITPSRDRQIEHYPCDVWLHDGTIVKRVCVVSEIPYINQRRVYPEKDCSISISDVASLIESPSRLPPRFANELYRAGESGMGYRLFTVVFSRRFGILPRRQAYVTGASALDFIEYPSGVGPKNVKAILPHVGRDASPRTCPKYSWCLYSE